MKLYTGENAELMEVTGVRSEGGNLVVVGTIMGAMPVEAILPPSELRQSLRLLSGGLIWAALRMLFKR